MSTRNLDALLEPSSVVLLGASASPGSVGAALAANLGAAGFTGSLYCVHPRLDRLPGFRVYRALAELPETPDLAVIATPAPTVPAVLAEAAERGVRAAVVISAGFAELGSEEGRSLQQAVLDAARPRTMRVVGPNCLGVAVPGRGLNASFAHLPPHAGRLAFLAQSGAVVASILDWAAPRGIGFSHLLSLGNMADVDAGDLLDQLAGDPDTDAILLYVEGVTRARKFMSAARAAARRKPVVVLKAGRFPASARAASSHTGAMASDDAAYDAAFRRAGLVRVDTLEELFSAAAVLSGRRVPQARPLTIISNGGGMGVLASDALVACGGELAELTDETIAALDAVLPATWSRANPVDLIGDADGRRYIEALSALAQRPEVGPILVLNCPTGAHSSLPIAREVADYARRSPGQGLIACWIGDQTVREAWGLLEAAGVPCYGMPDQAVRAFEHVVAYRRGQAALMETPPSIPEPFTPDVDTARAILAEALAAERESLSQEDARRLLACYRIPVVAGRMVTTPEAAGATAAEIGAPVALKLVSPDVSHKTDVGGVALNLAGEAETAEAARRMLARLAEAYPDVRIDGLMVEPMVARGRAMELILGIAENPVFGPMILFGQGGTATELLDDKALGLPPLNLRLAQELMSRTRVWRLLQPHRGQPGMAVDAVALSLVKLAQLVADLPEVKELDINPLRVDDTGVIAVDARCRIAPAAERDRLAIRPYPSELEQRVTLDDGRALLLRPIVPEDEPALIREFARLAPEEIYHRFFSPLHALSHRNAARLSQIDYDREMALVLAGPGVPGEAELFGGVRLLADPDIDRAEFTVLVRHELAGRGLGRFLMQRLIDYATGRGITELYGEVLADNRAMLRLADALGFAVHGHSDEPGVVRVSLRLAPAAEG